MTDPRGVPPALELAISDLLHDIDKQIGDSATYAITEIVREHFTKWASGWQPIATCPESGVEAVLYFPAEPKAQLSAMTRVDFYPCRYPRKPTHWMPLPAGPKADDL